MSYSEPIKGLFLKPRGAFSRTGKIGLAQRLKLELYDTAREITPKSFHNWHSKLDLLRRSTINFGHDLSFLRFTHKLALKEGFVAPSQEETAALLAHQKGLLGITRHLVEPAIDNVINAIFTGVKQIGYKRAFLYAYDEKTGELQLKSAINMDEAKDSRYIKGKRPEDVVDDKHKVDAISTKKIQVIRTRVANRPPEIVIPLLVEDKVVGLLKVDNNEKAPLFPSGIREEVTKEILETFANIAGAAMRNASLFKEIKETQNKFDEAMTQARLGEVVKMLGHHLNNNLASIDLTLQLFSAQIAKLISGKRPLDIAAITEIQSKLPGMQGAVDKLAQIRDLIQPYLFPISEAQKLPLHEIIDSAIGKAKIFASRNGVFFNVNPEGAPAYIMASRELEFALQQIFKNSIEAINAKKASNPQGFEGLVRVSADRKNGKVLLMVEDNGIGIPEKYINQVFDPFISGGAKDAQANFGLGLSFANRVIEILGGNIQLTSSPDGTTVLIELPVAS